MTRQEVQQLLMIISATFPNFKVENKTETVNAWLMFLEEYEASNVMLSLKAYVKNNKTGFAPSVSQLIEAIEKPSELTGIDDPTAWALVRDAISKSTYNSEREFAKLPPLVQKAVGTPKQLYLWSTDDNFNDNVVMSVFLRNYHTIVERDKEYNRLPEQMRLMVDQTCERLGQIKVNEPLRIATIEQPPVEEIVREDNGEHYIDTARYLDNLTKQLS